MDHIQEKLHKLGLTLPQPLQTPPGIILPFQWVKVSGNKAYISGHLPTLTDGSITKILGKVGDQVSIEQAYEVAGLVALSILASLKRELGSLDKIKSWLRIFGMVNSAPGFTQQPKVINGISDLILKLFGPQIGSHTRSAVGVAELPFGVPVEAEAEIEIL